MRPVLSPMPMCPTHGQQHVRGPSGPQTIARGYEFSNTLIRGEARLDEPWSWKTTFGGVDDDIKPRSSSV